MSTTNEAALKLAREIAARDAADKGAHGLATYIRDEDADDTIGVRCALAAILEVTERAAKRAECTFDDRPNSRSGHYSEMDWTDGFRDGTRLAATALRKLEHLV